MHYLLGCATKYLARWELKNGKQDLRKAIHYIEKAAAKGISFPKVPDTINERFVSQFESRTAGAMVALHNNDFSKAVGILENLIYRGV